jgi:hypothetical protein
MHITANIRDWRTGAMALLACALMAVPAGVAAHSSHRHARPAHRTAHAHHVAKSGRHSRHAGLLRTPYSNAVYYTGGAGDYLSQTEGESRWPDGHSISVYVASGRSSFPGIVARCFSEWSRASGGRIHFYLTSSPSADYTISWSGHQREVSEGTEAGLTTTDTYVDDDGREYIEHAQTRILTRYDGRMLSDKEIADTCLHEIGHGLGIEGHSSNCADIMYYAVSSRQTGHLTARDANTIARLYSE